MIQKVVSSVVESHLLKFYFSSVHIRIHLPELHEETHSHKEVIIHDDHHHDHHGGGHGGHGGGFAEGLIGGFLSGGGGGGGHVGHGGGGHGHGSHGSGFGGHGGGFGGHGHSHGGGKHGGHGNDDLLIATIGKAFTVIIVFYYHLCSGIFTFVW